MFEYFLVTSDIVTGNKCLYMPHRLYEAGFFHTHKTKCKHININELTDIDVSPPVSTIHFNHCNWNMVRDVNYFCCLNFCEVWILLKPWTDDRKWCIWTSAVVDLPVSTLSRQPRIFDCRHTVPTLSTIFKFIIQSIFHYWAEFRQLNPVFFMFKMVIFAFSHSSVSINTVITNTLVMAAAKPRYAAI